jgi:hypothetical protein
MLPLLSLKLQHKKLPHRKLLAEEDEPLYALHFLRSLTKQKEKRRNSKYGKRSGPIHLLMSLKTYITP